MALYCNGNKVAVYRAGEQTNTGNRLFQTSVGQVGLQFTDNSSSQMNAAQSIPSYGKTVSGEYNDTLEWGTTASNIYLCVPSTGNHVSSISLNTSHIIVAEIQTKKYAIGSYNGIVTTMPYVAGMTLDNHYKWILTTNSNGYKLQNSSNGLYAYVTSSGVLGLTETVPKQYFGISSGLLSYSYKTGDTWVAARYSSSAIYVIKNQSYSARLYSASLNNGTVTLTPIKDSNNTLAGTARVLILKTASNTRYIVGYTGSSLTISSISPRQENDDVTMTFTHTTVTSNWSRYQITVSGMNGEYSLLFTNGNKYLTPPSGNLSSSSRFSPSTTQSTISYNDTNGIHVVSGYNLGPFGITNISQGFTTTSYNNDISTGGTTLFYKYNAGTWTPFYGTLTPGNSYAMAVREFVPDGGTNTALWLVLYPKYVRNWSASKHTFLANGTIISNNEIIATGVTQTAHGSGYDLMVDGSYIIFGGGIVTSSVQPTEYWTIVDGEMVWNYSVTTETDGVETTTWHTLTFGIESSEWKLTMHTFSSMSDITITDDCAFTVTQGAVGFGIYWNDNGLNVIDDELALLPESLEWSYIPNSQTPENSRLWTVEEAERTKPVVLLYANNHKI